jgi:ribonuclease HII
VTSPFKISILKYNMLKYKNNINEIGLDEAGRGPLIGRVYAGAVIWNNDIECDMINDSKKMTPKKRKLALEWIKNNIKYWGVGYADENEIDLYNIVNATKLAMDRAIDDLKTKYNNNIEYLIIDGIGWENKFNNYNVENIVKGDSKYYSIASASIIAKEYHDQYILDLIKKDNSLDEKYNLSKNMGYPTKKHFEGLNNYGLSIYHRKTFCKKFIFQ